MLLPQEYISPYSVAMIVWAFPQDTETTGMRMSRGLNILRLVPSAPVPSWPKRLFPVDKMVWSAQQMTACSAPAAMAAIVVFEANSSFCIVVPLRESDCFAAASFPS